MSQLAERTHPFHGESGGELGLDSDGTTWSTWALHASALMCPFHCALVCPLTEILAQPTPGVPPPPPRRAQHQGGGMS